ncbi:MAG: TonB-system energizer ExbB [Hahellaceae bacterium]|nr:TonB-system energizer ExbB [Hahellaceae bacterium]
MAFLTLYLDYLVFGLLGLMSFIMLSLVIERLLFYRQVSVNDFTHIETLQVALTKNLTGIASIASNAPYVGLLGTVLGILITFNQMGTEGNVDASNIMVSLAMALKATAAGLIVAIPSTIFYNGLMRRSETLISQWKAEHE